LNFCLFFIFSCRQAYIGSTALSLGVNDTGEKLSALSLTPVKSFLALLLTPVVNFSFIGYFLPVSMETGKNFMV
jgi:hypothetical protein